MSPDMRAPSQILSLLKSRRPGHALPRAFYTDPAIYQADLEAIWYRDWLFVGHDCELASAGAYFTVQVGDYPLVVLRGADGVIRALHNSCRHRGSRICAEAKGAVARLVCPYHSWTYELDGRLLYARDMDAGFDPAAHGLKPVHCASFAGYIWICLAHEAPDFARFRATAEPYLLPHRLGETKVAAQSTIIENGNWKLVWENNRECYHCAANHPELCRTYPEDPAVTGVDGGSKDPAIQASWQRWEQAGLPSRFEIAADGQYRAARMPLLREAESYTMSGQPAVRRRLSDSVAEPRIGTMLLFHYPTTWNHVMGDHAISFRVLPIGPGQTQVTTKWLVHKDAVAGVDYDVEDLTRVWTATNTQDQRIVEENQRGVNSPAFEPGPYSTVHEDGVVQFLGWYAGALERGLDGAGIRLKSVA